MKKLFFVLVAVVCALSFFGCATSGVKRIDPNKQTDLSGYWNDTDVRIIAETLVEECVNAPAIIKYIKENQKASIDSINDYCSLGFSVLNSTLMTLELKGFIRILPGKVYEILS